MTLQQPKKTGRAPGNQTQILCHKCGNPVVFDKSYIAHSGRKIPLEPGTNFEPHVKHCMYADLKWNRHTESLFTDFLSLVPSKRPKRIIGAVGRAK